MNPILPRVAELPETPDYQDLVHLGRRAERWLSERSDPARMRDSGTVKFTPHTPEEQAAWRARVAARKASANSDAPKTSFRLLPRRAVEARIRRQGGKVESK
jgi:hypothetical protein